MKVAFLSQPFDSVLPPNQNSIGLWTYETSRRLANYCNVIVFIRGGLLKNKKFSYEQVQYQSIPVGFDLYFMKFLEFIVNFFKLKSKLFKSRLYYIGYYFQIAMLLKRERCDVVHVHQFSQFCTLLKFFNPKIKIVLHMQCEWLTQLDFSTIEKRLNKTDLIIGCSDYITELIQKRFPTFTYKCKTVYNGVDVNHFDVNKVKNKNNSKKLLFVGRVSPEKGVHNIISAFYEVIKSFPDTQLSIIGPQGQLPLEYIISLSDDPKIKNLASFYNGQSRNIYFSKLQNMIKPGIIKQITFIKQIPQVDLVNYYAQTDVLINPSFSESFGIALVEAMACKVPVVATRIGGMQNIVIEGETGFLVESGDVTALSEAILKILQNDELKKKMGSTGRKRTEDLFTWNKITNSLLDNFKKIYEQ